MLVATAIAFLMAVTVPDAFGDAGGWFATTHIAVRVVGLALYGRVAWDDVAKRAVVRRFALLSAGGLAAVPAAAWSGVTPERGGRHPGGGGDLRPVVELLRHRQTPARRRHPAARPGRPHPPGPRRVQHPALCYRLWGRAAGGGGRGGGRASARGAAGGREPRPGRGRCPVRGRHRGRAPLQRQRAVGQTVGGPCRRRRRCLAHPRRTGQLVAAGGGPRTPPAGRGGASDRERVEASLSAAPSPARSAE